MGDRDNVNAMVEAITSGLDGQRMTDLLRGELARRLKTYLAGDRASGVAMPEPPPPRRAPCIRSQVAQAVAIVTAGRVRPPRRHIRRGPGAAEWRYSGYGFADWAGVLDAIGHETIAAHVERLLNGDGAPLFRARLGGRGGMTLTVTWAA